MVQAEKIDYQTHEKPTDYMRFVIGLNVVRILSDGYLISKHQFRVGVKFVSTDCSGEGCENCKNGNAPKTRYVWIVIDRNGGQVRVMETGVLVGEAVCKIAKLGDIRKVDLEIVRTGKGRETTYIVRKAKVSKEVTEVEMRRIKHKLPILKMKYIEGKKE